MILWRFRETPETRRGFPCAAFRDVLKVGGMWAIGVAIMKQYHCDGEWNDGDERAGVFVLRQWRFGFGHVYYDGPHCSFSLGPFMLGWSGGFWSGHCCKCEGGK